MGPCTKIKEKNNKCCNQLSIEIWVMVRKFDHWEFFKKADVFSPFTLKYCVVIRIGILFKW